MKKSGFFDSDDGNPLLARRMPMSTRANSFMPARSFGVSISQAMMEDMAYESSNPAHGPSPSKPIAF